MRRGSEQHLQHSSAVADKADQDLDKGLSWHTQLPLQRMPFYYNALVAMLVFTESFAYLHGPPTPHKSASSEVTEAQTYLTPAVLEQINSTVNRLSALSALQVRASISNKTNKD